jgi:hypothetical protein
MPPFWARSRPVSLAVVLISIVIPFWVRIGPSRHRCRRLILMYLICFWTILFPPNSMPWLSPTGPEDCEKNQVPPHSYIPLWVCRAFTTYTSIVIQRKCEEVNPIVNTGMQDKMYKNRNKNKIVCKTSYEGQKNRTVWELRCPVSRLIHHSKPSSLSSSTLLKWNMCYWIHGPHKEMDSISSEPERIQIKELEACQYSLQVIWTTSYILSQRITQPICAGTGFAFKFSHWYWNWVFMTSFLVS